MSKRVIRKRVVKKVAVETKRGLPWNEIDGRLEITMENGGNDCFSYKSKLTVLSGYIDKFLFTQTINNGCHYEDFCIYPRSKHVIIKVESEYSDINGCQDENTILYAFNGKGWMIANFDDLVK